MTRDTSKDKITALLQRSLGLKHKMKVHDSMPLPDTHEQIALNQISRFELEDELKAIEQILEELRAENVAKKRSEILKNGVKKKSTKL